MTSAPDQPSALDYPELIIAIAGPIGVSMDLIARGLEAALADVGYSSTLIKLTTEMTRFSITNKASLDECHNWIGADTFNTYMRKMSEANALRKQYDDPAVLARISIDAIRADRSRMTNSEDVVRPKHAYIVRQLKRPEEVVLLRKVYGRQFVLASAYAPEAQRREQLCE